MIFTTLAIIGIVLTTVQTVLAIRLRRRVQASSPVDAFVSILKPVCGLDDELEENLLSFVSLHGMQYEVIISIEDRDDPALPLATTMVRDHPDVFRLVVGGGSRRRGIINRKVERLVDAAAIARGSILFISDSNVRVEPDDIRRTIDRFSDPRLGCVSNLFVGAGAKDLGAAIESLHLLMFVAPGAALAGAAGVPCVVGKSMAISRNALDAIGGFHAFARVLAEDQAIGLAVKNAGFEVVLSPIVVRNIIVRRSVKRALERQIRWNKIRYAFSRRLFAAEILLNPLLFAMFASPLVVLIVLAARYAQAFALRRTTRSDLSIWQVPLLDAVMLYAWFVPFFSNRITWRGYEARIGPGTEFLECGALAPP
ncbi:MAG TPA: glycosyltransferase [Thermoanaerobaculia bacterium]|jgi:ceramide glucosyltransferase